MPKDLGGPKPFWAALGDAGCYKLITCSPINIKEFLFGKTIMNKVQRYSDLGKLPVTHSSDKRIIPQSMKKPQIKI